MWLVSLATHLRWSACLWSSTCLCTWSLLGFRVWTRVERFRYPIPSLLCTLNFWVPNFMTDCYPYPHIQSKLTDPILVAELLIFVMFIISTRWAFWPNLDHSFLHILNHCLMSLHWICEDRPYDKATGAWPSNILATLTPDPLQLTVLCVPFFTLIFFMYPILQVFLFQRVLFCSVPRRLEDSLN